MTRPGDEVPEADVLTIAEETPGDMPAKRPGDGTRPADDLPGDPYNHTE
jgi:hypothetical protein